MQNTKPKSRRAKQNNTISFRFTSTNTAFDAAGAKLPLANSKLPSSESSASCRKAPSHWLTLATSQKLERWDAINWYECNKIRRVKRKH
jgi:hypothetical protein